MSMTITATTRRTTSRCFSLAGLLSTVLIAPLSAQSITVTNPGFEDVTGLTVFREFDIGTPPGWVNYDPNNVIANGAVLGTLFQPEDNFFNEPAPDGSRVAILYNDSQQGAGEYGIQQTLPATLQPNSIYTISVEVGDILSGFDTANQFYDLRGFPGYRVEFLADLNTSSVGEEIVLGSDDNTLAATLVEGNFDLSTFDVIIPASHPQLGESVAIRLISLNQIPIGITPTPILEVDFDSVAVSVAPLDVTAPTSAAATTDPTQVGGAMTGTYTATDDDSGVATVELFAKEPNGNWANAGTVTGNVWSFTPTQTGNAADGIYEFTTVATDVQGNSETPPTGMDAGDVSITYNDAENSPFTVASVADGPTTFPLTSTLDLVITFSGGATGGPITASRTVGNVAPAGFNSERLIDESLNLSGSFTGNAAITWNFDPTSDDTLGANPLNTVFQFESGVLTNSYPVTPAGTTLTIGPVTAFSDWYAGSNNANVLEWTVLE